MSAFVFGLSLRWKEFQTTPRHLYSLLDGWVAVALFAAGLALLAARLFGRATMRRRFATALILLSFAPGFGRYVVYHSFWNAAERQRQDLVRFGELSPGPVLDGFTGLGCLRPHAGYWWWINHHSLPLMRKEGALPNVLELIRERIPSVIVFDDGVRRIGGVEPLLLLGYEQIPFPGPPVFVRRESAAR
jgi:hypothetical protein